MEYLSHSIRVRGLKCYIAIANLRAIKVALYTSAWIEIWLVLQFNRYAPLSHSIRVRGLKSQYLIPLLINFLVALYTSAWIEIVRKRHVDTSIKRRTLYECVD